MAVDEHNPKGWTFASFETHVDSEIKALKEATGIAMTASEKAIDKAEKSDDKRFSLLIVGRLAAPGAAEIGAPKRWRFPP